MFDIQENDVTGQTNKLLFNIWHELKKHDMQIISKISREELNKDEVKTTPLVTEVQCKYCGGTHRNRQSMAACAKKHKKDGV
jgi:hypothetical protein